MISTDTPFPVRCLTPDPGYYFFGYYDKLQFDRTDSRVLALRTSFQDRSPQPTDEATIGVIELAGEAHFQSLAATRAWCWQQGCMLQWVPGTPAQIIFNDRIGDRFVAVRQDLDSGRTQTLPRPIYALSPDASLALSLNFARLAVKRPGYGYNGVRDQGEDNPAPADDGIYLMELATGNHRLIVDLASLSAYQPLPGMESANHWVNHLLFNHRGDRFIFLHRWGRPGGAFSTRMYTANRDGTERHVVPIQDASHFIWFDADTILVWATTEQGSAYYLCRDQSSEVRKLGEGVLVANGHCSMSPDGRWVLTDEYPDAADTRPLILYRVADGTRLDLGRYYSPAGLGGEMRCDLHPRWSRDGQAICFDSAHEGSRRMYWMDVSTVTGRG